MAIKVGPCGGDGGELQNLEKTIHKIQVAYTIDDNTECHNSSYINAITFTVECVPQPVIWGKPEQAKKKKNEVKNKTCYPILPGPFAQTEAFTLQPGECITSVKGYYGKTRDLDPWNGLRSLTFETIRLTGEPAIYGPFGKEVGTQFELPAIVGKIIGFHGRSGARLDALGVYVKDGHTDGSTGTGF